MSILPETSSLTSNDLLVVEKDSTGELNSIKQSNLNVGVATRANTIDGTDTTAGETGSTSTYSLAFVEAGSSASNGTKTLRYAKNLTLTPETATTPSTHVSSKLRLVSGPVDIGGTVTTPAASQDLVMAANQAGSCTIQSQAFSGGVAPLGGTVTPGRLELNPDGGVVRLNDQIEVQRASSFLSYIQGYQENTATAGNIVIQPAVASRLAIGVPTAHGGALNHKFQVIGRGQFEVLGTGLGGIYLESGVSGALIEWQIQGAGTAYNLHFVLSSTLQSYIRPNGQYVAVSDSRRKTNQQPLGSVLSQFMELTPKTYTHNGVESIGLIAQEVYDVFNLCAIPPDSTSEEDVEKNPWGLCYNSVAMYHIKATQELKAEVDTLKATVALLQQQVASLMAN